MKDSWFKIRVTLNKNLNGVDESHIFLTYEFWSFSTNFVFNRIPNTGSYTHSQAYYVSLSLYVSVYQ